MAASSAIIQDYLRVPENVSDTSTETLEKPVFASGRLSRISMIIEEEYEMFSSDDEINIEVPNTPSPINNMPYPHTTVSFETNTSPLSNKKISGPYTPYPHNNISSESNSSSPDDMILVPQTSLHSNDIISDPDTQPRSNNVNTVLDILPQSSPLLSVPNNPSLNNKKSSLPSTSSRGNNKISIPVTEYPLNNFKSAADNEPSSNTVNTVHDTATDSNIVNSNNIEPLNDNHTCDIELSDNTTQENKVSNLQDIHKHTLNVKTDSATKDQTVDTNNDSAIHNDFNTASSSLLDDTTAVKHTTEGEVTIDHLQDNCCNQTGSLIDSDSTSPLSSDSVTSLAPSLLDESLHGNNEFSFTSESDHSDDISDDVFKDDSAAMFDKKADNGQATGQLTTQNALAPSTKTSIPIHKILQPEEISTYEQCNDKSVLGPEGQTGEQADIRVNNEDKSCLWEEVLNTNKNQSECYNLSFNEQANMDTSDTKTLRDELRVVSASNVIIEAELNSPVRCKTQDNHTADRDNNESQTEHNAEYIDSGLRTGRTCSHHKGNYRKIKLEGRRRRHLSIDGLLPKPEQAQTVNDDHDNIMNVDNYNQDKNIMGKLHVTDGNYSENLQTVNDIDHVIRQETEAETANESDVHLKFKSKSKDLNDSDNLENGVPASKRHSVLSTRHEMTNKTPKHCQRVHDFDADNSLNTGDILHVDINEIGRNKLKDKHREKHGNGQIKNRTKTEKTYERPLPNINTSKHKLLPDQSTVPAQDKPTRSIKSTMVMDIQEKQPLSKLMKRGKITDNLTGSESEYNNGTSRDQIDCNLNVTNGADENKPETTGNEIFMSDDNRTVIKTRKKASHAGKISQYHVERYNSATAVNCNDMDNNFDTKSLLLPIVHETGNCAIKLSAREMVVADSNLHYCQTKQLSRHLNDKKNNEINQPKHSIINSQKILNKRGTLEDLYGKKDFQPSFARPPSYDHNARVTVGVNRKNPTSNKLLNLTDEEKYRKRERKLPVVNRIKQEPGVSNVLVDKDGKLNAKMSRKEVSQSFARNLSAGFRIPSIERTESNSSSHSLCGTPSFTDTARLRSIRKWLKLPVDKYDVTSENKRKEAELIIQQILDNVLKDVCHSCVTADHLVIDTHRCTIQDEEGDESLGCLLQSTQDRVDPSLYYCDVIDPLDTTPVTKKHEHLISNIIKISSKYSLTKTELIVNIPISHWYVEPWQEVIIRQQDNNGHWKDASDSVDIVKIDDTNKVVYGVKHVITDLCSLAVICRPQTTTVTLTDYDHTVEAISDSRVKMHMFASCVQKHLSFQVIPVSLKNLEDFQDSSGQKKMAVVASSPLIIVDVKDQDPESLAFDVPYVVNHPKVDNTLNSRRKSSVHQIQSFSKQYGTSTNSTWKPSNMTSRLGVPLMSSLHRNNPNQLLFHLVQLDDDDNVRIKLLENTDCTNDVTSVPSGDDGGSDCDNKDSFTNEYRTVNFSLYDRYARVIAVETKGATLYSDVQNVTTPFVNFVVKHRVKITLSIDPRNVYSVLFTAYVEHPHREEKFSLQKTYENFKSVDMREILLHEGDVVAIAFRGNVSVPDNEKLVYSFHGCRGVRRHFDLQVNNPARQRSLKTYHGALQVFTYKPPRYSALDKSLAPCEKNGWELSVEFPLILPKYLKTTPIIVNKAPVSLKFQEPLTLDFVRALCTELSKEWWIFAQALGMGHARIQALKQHHKNQSSDTAVMDVIINWMKIQTISQDKVSPVINALRTCNKWNLASELSHRYSAQRVRKSRVVRDKHLQNVFSIISQNKTASLKWREIVRYLFIDNGGHIDDVIGKIDKHYKDNHTKCVEALKHWKTETDDPSVWTLIDVLRSCGCNIAADTLVQLEIKHV